MADLISQKFHVHAAKQFVESLTEPANDVYYLFIGRPVPWGAGNSAPSDSIANTTFEYWRDIVSVKRIKSTDISHVTPRYNWSYGAQYAMHDHRTCKCDLVANTSYPFYVLTSEDHVFKCISNGKGSATSVPSNSTSEPTITGQADISRLTLASGSPYNYVWKYLYTLNETQKNKYLTTDYIPVTATGDVLNEDGDVLDDGSNQYVVFNSARSTGNGEILSILVESPGSGYTSAPTIIITGDGVDATAVATITSNSVSSINIISGGLNYSRASVYIEGGGGSGATATAIISPRSSFTNSTGTYYITNHGIDNQLELDGRYVMLSIELSGNESGVIAASNEYRRVGILKNPVLNNTNTIATGNVYSQTTNLTLLGTSGLFTKNEIVWQSSTNAYGVVVEQIGQMIKLVSVNGTFSTTGNIQGIGNGNTEGMIIGAINIPATPEPFTPTVPPSSVVASITGIESPSLSPYSGDILYVDNINTVIRANDQTEIIRTVMTF
jgi:hypothetical protein